MNKKNNDCESTPQPKAKKSTSLRILSSFFLNKLFLEGCVAIPTKILKIIKYLICGRQTGLFPLTLDCTLANRWNSADDQSTNGVSFAFHCLAAAFRTSKNRDRKSACQSFSIFLSSTRPDTPLLTNVLFSIQCVQHFRLDIVFIITLFGFQFRYDCCHFCQFEGILFSKFDHIDVSDSDPVYKQILESATEKKFNLLYYIKKKLTYFTLVYHFEITKFNSAIDSNLSKTFESTSALDTKHGAYQSWARSRYVVVFIEMELI